jgi:hypothetical protein
MSEIPDPAAAAVDPDTSAAALAELAAAHPELIASIYVHPNVYEDLKEWIRTHHPEQLDSEQVDPAKPAVTGSWWDRPNAALFTSLAIGAVALVVVLAIAISASLTVASLDSERDAVMAAPLDVPTPDADLSPVSTPTPSAAPSRVPDTCEQLFSAGMRGTIEAAGFRSSTSAHATTPAGTDDAVLADLLRSKPALVCTWHRSDSDPAGIETSVLEVDETTAAAAIARFQALGFSPIAELGSTRYFIERSSAGESHIIRDGVWFATRWVEYGPNGYTADMVGQVFG